MMSPCSSAALRGIPLRCGTNSVERAEARVSDAPWNEGLFNRFERLVEITVCGVRFSMPENNNLLRGFQYAKADALMRGNYCWNGDCINCIVWIDHPEGKSKGLACRTEAVSDMTISAVSDDLRIDLMLNRAE
ncbi:MAG: hypothetical protein DMF61_14195 [Blastocatellia bacterium AA13]|nr:MAG: hypothetical protein DMF61_14195 [Blastocatellia bacterium AA13]